MGDGSRLLGQLAELVLAAAAESPHRPVEVLLAESLRRLTVPRACTVHWLCQLSSGQSALSSARCAGLFAEAEPLILERAAAMATWPPLHFPRDQHFERAVSLSAPEGPWLRVALGLRTDPRTHILALELDLAPEDAEGRGRAEALGEALRLHTSQLRHLFHILRALYSLAAERHRAALRRDVEALLATAAAPPPDLLEALPTATALLARLTLEQVHPWGPEAIPSLAEPLITWAVDGLLGSGLALSRLPLPARSVLTALCDAVAGLLQTVDPTSLPQHRRRRLESLEDTLRALLSPPRPLPPLAVGTSGGLLSRWVGLHGLADGVCRGGRGAPPLAEAEAVWKAVAEETRRWLPHLLARPPRSGGPTSAVRTWMHLWFALELLQPPPSSSGAADRFSAETPLVGECWRIRRALARVMQEGLRAQGLRRRAVALPPPAAQISALRVLVAHHARLEADLPRALDVLGHLTELGEGPAGTGHLQHVLDVYIAGYLLCALRLAGGETLGGLLASRSRLRPGRTEIQVFKAAFSLAALFHDTGMRLFTPTPAALGTRLLRGDPVLTDAMRDIEAQATRTGAVLAARSLDALRGGSHLDPVGEPTLLRWLEAQQQAGAPDHALLGAWYLLRICGGIDGLHAEVVQAAVRATLLHAAVGERLDPDLDPAAALLVLCDELFDWSPEAPPLDLGEALSVPAHPTSDAGSRAAALSFPGLVRRVHPETGRLDLSLETEGSSWPIVELTLHPSGVQAAPSIYTWLTLAQNLGRLRPAQSGWAPEVRLHARIPPRIHQSAGSTFALLERVLHDHLHLLPPHYTHLQAWLAAQPRCPDRDPLAAPTSAGWECFCLRACGQILLPGGARLDFPPLARALLEATRELERGDAASLDQNLSAYPLDG